MDIIALFSEELATLMRKGTKYRDVYVPPFQPQLPPGSPDPTSRECLRAVAYGATANGQDSRWRACASFGGGGSSNTALLQLSNL